MFMFMFLLFKFLVFVVLNFESQSFVCFFSFRILSLSLSLCVRKLRRFKESVSVFLSLSVFGVFSDSFLLQAVRIAR